MEKTKLHLKVVFSVKGMVWEYTPGIPSVLALQEVQNTLTVLKTLNELNRAANKPEFSTPKGGIDGTREKTSIVYLFSMTPEQRTMMKEGFEQALSEPDPRKPEDFSATLVEVE